MSQTFDINSLLDGTLDDLADLPEFKPYPAGTYQAKIKFDQKLVGGHPCIEAKISLIETLELANADETPPTAKAETTVLYMMDNEMGQGSFKKIMTSAASHFGVKTPRELMEDLSQSEVALVIKVRSNEAKTKQYNDIVELRVI